MAITEFDGIQFNYEFIGRGPAVVFTHGLTGDLEQPRELIGPLPGYRLLIWDVRGHGKTKPLGPAEKLTFSTFAKDLAALMDHLEMNSAIVGGISMGAAVAVRFAVEYPQRVRGLVLVRPAWEDHPLPEGLRLLPRIAEYLERFGPDCGVAEFKKLPEMETIRGISPDTAEGLLQQFHKPGAMELRFRLQRIPGDAPIEHWSQVDRLQMPALVIGNEPDYLHPLSFASTWAKHLRHGRLAQITSKFIQPEEHVQAFRGEFSRFLRSLTNVQANSKSEKQNG